MTHVRVSTTIAAPRRRVWESLRDIASHVEWMRDAAAIRFTSERREGVGTTFDCDTVVGPFRLTDRMEVVEWVPRRTIAIRHVGLVRGTGRFVLSGRGRRTRFSWDERLRLPAWLGGPLGGLVAAPLLRRLWAANLATLKAHIEGG